MRLSLRCTRRRCDDVPKLIPVVSPLPEGREPAHPVGSLMFVVRIRLLCCWMNMHPIYHIGTHLMSASCLCPIVEARCRYR